MAREYWLKLAIIGAIIIVNAVWMGIGGTRFDWPSLTPVLGVCSAMGVIAVVYHRFRPNEAIGTMAAETIFVLTFSAAGSMLSYLVTSLNRPLIDDALLTLDAAMGFDWAAYIGFVNERPWLGDLSTLVYMTTIFQVALAITILPLIGRAERARELCLAVMISALAAIAISGIWPSAGALGYLRPEEAFYMQNAPMVDLAYKQAFFDLREGAISLLSLTEPKGLIAFPSYHVALSVLLIVAFRGVRGWFWPLVVLNVLVTLSTPVDGGHHMIDAVAGAVVALICAAATIEIRARLAASAAAERPVEAAARSA